MIKITLQGLIDWLKTKPVEENYNCTDGQDCLIAQYLKHLGAENVSVGAECYYFTLPNNGGTVDGTISEELNIVAMEDDPYGPSLLSFGSALERALALQATGYVDPA